MEPFGYFKAEPFGWTDCAETDEGAQPLFDQAAIDALERQRDELLAALIGLNAAMACYDKTPEETLALAAAESAIASVKGGAA